MKIIPDLILEQYVLGELPQDKKDEITFLMGKDRVLFERIEAIRVSDAAFHNKYPFELYRGKFSDKAFKKAKIFPFKKSIAAFSLVAAAACVAIIIRVVPDILYYSGNDVIIKGYDFNMYIYRKNSTAADLLSDGDSVSAGDLIQIAYQVPPEKYCAILSIDGRSNVTFHYSTDKKRDNTVSGKVLLPESYQLDDAPDFERFFLIVSDKPVLINDVLGKVSGFALDRNKNITDTLPLDNSFSQKSILLRKVK